METTYSTADVARMLAHVYNTVLSLFAPVVLISGLYGIFFVISIASLHVQWNSLKCTKTPSTSKRIMMLVVLVLFGSTTGYCSLKIYDAFQSVKIILTSQSNMIKPLAASAYEANGAMLDAVFASFVLMLTTVWISDAVVAWRACVIWANDIRIMIVLGMALLFTLATTIWHAVCSYIYASYQFGPPEHEDIVLKAYQNMNMTDEIRIVASLATNWLATLAIGYKLWLYRKNILPPLRHLSGKGRTHVYTILTNLVEMGLFLGIYQIAMSTLGINLYHINVNTFRAYNHLTLAHPFVAAINPTLTILLVNKNRSIAELSKNDKTTARFSQAAGVGGARHPLVFAPTSICTHYIRIYVG